MKSNLFIILVLIVENIFAINSINFVGDIMMGRRYYCTSANSYDSDNQELEDDLCEMSEGFCDGFGSEGIIPSCGSNILFNGVSSYFQDPNVINVGNMESVITDDTSTPHNGYDSCKIVFHSCPEIVQDLVDVNFHYLNLGNNHVLDYMEHGILSTYAYLDSAGIFSGGAGLDSLEACSPSYIYDGDNMIAFLSSSNVNGEDLDDICEPLLTATANSPGFCGTSEENITNQINFLGEQIDSVIVVYQMHTGYEYNFEPNDFRNSYSDYNPFNNQLSQRSIELAHYAIDAGADIVIQHHPHVIQGLELYNNKLIAHSLGNFIFDQNFPETWSSIILNAEYNDLGFNNYNITPIYLSYYLPQLATGNLGNYILDFLSMKSRELNTFIKIDRENNLAEIVLDEPFYTYLKDTTLVLLPDSSGGYISSPIKLNKKHHIIDISSDLDIEFRLGREVIWMGDFDYHPEIDDCVNKNTYYWNLRTSEISDSVSWNGDYSIKMLRDPNNTDNALVDNYYCYPLISNPNEVTVRGFIKTSNSNNAKIGIRFYESRCSGTITTEYTNSADGNSDWLEYHQNINVPSEAYYMDLRMVSFPPDSGLSIVHFDNVGIIEWEGWLYNDYEILHPNDYYYYQIKSSSEIVDVVIEEKSYFYEENLILGDNNFDGLINVIDIVRIVNIAIDLYEPLNTEFAASDMNQDGLVNVLDVIELVNIILSD